MRFHVLAVLFLFLAAGLNAQVPFFLNKKGVVLTYASKNAKGKISGYSETTVTAVDGNNSNCTIVYETMAMDAKKKPLLANPIDTKVRIAGGVVSFDPSSFAGQVMEGMQITGDNLLLPSTASKGDVLNDYSINITIGPMTTTTTVSNVNVVAEETLNINGTSIECLVVESSNLTKVIGIKQEMKQKIWYGRGVGMVKTEIYDKKGKLQSVQELIAVQGL